ncbi:chorismate mutase [Glaciibacter sp. 2TAF33]|uniref:chorismate mutase n=1 Tax=Glaciibacter sp. 2TAF33 TaxID=3233015 RepID=UPI003F91860A
MAQDERDETLRELDGIRQSIDNIDAALVHLLAERFKFTQQVGRLKATHGLPPADPERERSQIQRLRTLAEGAHLDPAFAEKWFNFVVAEVIHHHVILAGDQNAAPAAEAATADSAHPGDAHSGPAAMSGPKPGPAHVTPKPPATAS